jgi:predicted NBD/HSP70 family sugar kinase
MFYVGLDIHDKRIAICVLSDTGQVVRRAQVRTIDEMVRILQGLSIASRSATRPVAATATTTTCSARSPLGSPWRTRGDCG